MVQIPPNIEVEGKGRSRGDGDEAAVYLETIVNNHAAEGWEFHRVDEIGVRVRPGCLMGLFGAKADFVSYYVISFKRQST